MLQGPSGGTILEDGDPFEADGVPYVNEPTVEEGSAQLCDSLAPERCES